MLEATRSTSRFSLVDLDFYPESSFPSSLYVDVSSVSARCAYSPGARSRARVPIAVIYDEEQETQCSVVVSGMQQDPLTERSSGYRCRATENGTGTDEACDQWMESADCACPHTLVAEALLGDTRGVLIGGESAYRDSNAYTLIDLVVNDQGERIATLWYNRSNLVISANIMLGTCELVYETNWDIDSPQPCWDASTTGWCRHLSAAVEILARWDGLRARLGLAEQSQPRGEDDDVRSPDAIDGMILNGDPSVARRNNGTEVLIVPLRNSRGEEFRVTLFLSDVQPGIREGGCKYNGSGCAEFRNHGPWICRHVTAAKKLVDRYERERTRGRRLSHGRTPAPLHTPDELRDVLTAMHGAALRRLVRVPTFDIRLDQVAQRAIEDAGLGDRRSVIRKQNRKRRKEGS